MNPSAEILFCVSSLRTDTVPILSINFISLSFISLILSIIGSKAFSSCSFKVSSITSASSEETSPDSMSTAAWKRSEYEAELSVSSSNVKLRYRTIIREFKSSYNSVNIFSTSCMESSIILKSSYSAASSSSDRWAGTV